MGVAREPAVAPRDPAVAAGLPGRLLAGRGVPAPALVLTSVISVQLGAALAARMFGVVSPAGLTGVRLWTAAVITAVLGAGGLVRAVRGVITRRAWRDGAVVAAFGVTLGVMNFSIYQSMARIPLGIAVTIEFLGPLAVAVASSRRVADLAWVVLAGAGVALLSSGWADMGSAQVGAHPAGAGTIVAGIMFALAAAICWAGYILLSAATGRRFSGSSGLAIAMVIAAVVVTPAAAASSAGSHALTHPAVLATGVAAGLLSSVIPYRVELEALRRLPTRIFGIWMSLEPAIAALAGLVLLGQALAPREWAAVICVMAACAGASRGGTSRGGTSSGARPAQAPRPPAGPPPS